MTIVLQMPGRRAARRWKRTSRHERRWASLVLQDRLRPERMAAHIEAIRRAL